MSYENFRTELTLKTVSKVTFDDFIQSKRLALSLNAVPKFLINLVTVNHTSALTATLEHDYTSFI